MTRISICVICDAQAEYTSTTGKPDGWPDASSPSLPEQNRNEARLRNGQLLVLKHSFLKRRDTAVVHKQLESLTRHVFGLMIMQLAGPLQPPFKFLEVPSVR